MYKYKCPICGGERLHKIGTGIRCIRCGIKMLLPEQVREAKRGDRWCTICGKDLSRSDEGEICQDCGGKT